MTFAGFNFFPTGQIQHMRHITMAGLRYIKSYPFLGVFRQYDLGIKGLRMGKGGKTEQKKVLAAAQRSISDAEARYIEIWHDEARTLYCMWRFEPEQPGEAGQITLYC
jgi:hypothetical protein